MSFPPSNQLCAALLGLVLLLPGRVVGVDSLALRLGSLQGTGWSAEGIELHLNVQAGEPIGFRIRVARANFATLSEPVQDLAIRCPEGRLHTAGLACDDGRVQLNHPLLDKPEMRLSLSWDKPSGNLDLRLRELAAAGGKILLDVRWDPQSWQVSLDGAGVQPAKLMAALPALGVTVPPWELQGRLNLKLQLQGLAAAVQAVTWRTTLQAFGFSDPQGDYLGEGLAGDWKGNLRASAGSWSGTSTAMLNRGELLTPAFYLAAQPQPLSLSTTIGYQTAQQRLQLNDIKYRDLGAFDIDAAVDLALAEEAPLRHLELSSGGIPLDTLYRRYLQPVLAEGVAANLETAGDLGVHLSYRATGPSRLELDLRDIHFDGAQTPQSADLDDPLAHPIRPFGLYGLHGRLVWSDGSDAEVSELSWAGGHILEVIDLGSASARLEIDEQGLTLLEETEIPILDGSLLVASFSLARKGIASERVSFEGVLTPVSMERISETLGWPPLSGKLSGVIPSVSLEGGVLEVNGNLLIRVFDGEILLRNLRMEDLFGTWPVVTADLEVRNLDLEALTGAFAFGKITGRLEGRIKELRLENWAPVAFDARFATPESDRSPHRISQRAVDNISDLGGVGVSGALSRSFLRYFDEFGYKRLGISCRLHQGVCEMGGVAPAGDGYYLVEGGGVPRIGIVGFTRRTDWNRLVSQLKEIAAGSSGTPVIE